MRFHLSGPWIGRVAVAVAAALVFNLSLSSLGYEHDTVLISLLVATLVAGGVLALEALETHTQFSWTAPNPAAPPDLGEDAGTTSFRHLIEVHETSRDADDAVLWQIAELAQRRLRQVQGPRYAEDPARVSELLGPYLADLVMRDRRQRHHDTQEDRNPRFSVAQLREMVRRIEAL